MAYAVTLISLETPRAADIRKLTAERVKSIDLRPFLGVHMSQRGPRLTSLPKLG